MKMNNQKIGKIMKVPLRELWSKEDKDFTKWLEKNIDYLIEVLDFEINIEETEKNVGPFKVDLQGTDKEGNIVIIENQLEKTDHDHLGKIITYLTNLDAKIAIWITSDPVEAHIKAINWLNENSPDDVSFYLIKIEAIKIESQPLVAPLFTIIARPSEESREIGLEKKGYAQRHITIKEFWSKFIEEANKKTDLYQNISPRKESWLWKGTGIGGVWYGLVTSKTYVRVEFYIDTPNKENNKNIYDLLSKEKEEIETELGHNLTWERMDDNKASRIKYEMIDVNINNKEDWDKMISFLIENVIKFETVFSKRIPKIKRER